MSLLVFGQTGQVGIYLQRQNGPDAPYLILGRDRADLTDPERCAEIIRSSRPGAVINLAALHDVARAEADETLAMKINGEAPARMAQVCAEMNVPFVHISTADVFDGSGDQLWKPSDTPGPVNALGRTKLAGEEGIRAAGGPHVILRSSWVISAAGENPMTRVLKRARQESRLELPADQISAPTSAHDLAIACQIAAMRVIRDKSLSGTYHYQGKPHVSLADAARYMISEAGLPCEVVDIESDVESDGSIPVPLNTRLDCFSTDANLGIRSPDWKKAVQFILTDMGQAT